MGINIATTVCPVVQKARNVASNWNAITIFKGLFPTVFMKINDILVLKPERIKAEASMNEPSKKKTAVFPNLG
jgi:cell division protein FtsW (lipid II flippase)